MAQQTILVVETEDNVRRDICMVLELEGYRALAAPNSKIAIELAASQLPDLILLIRIPGI